MLFGPVVVGAVGSRHVHAVGVVVGTHDEIRPGLACRIGRIGSIGRGFCKISVLTQGAVHFVGGNMVETSPFIACLHLARSLHPVAARRFNEREGSHEVGFHKGARALDGVVHMTFRRKMDDAPDIVLGKQLFDERFVANVALHEGVIGHGLTFLQIVEIACVGELVEIDYMVIRVLLAEVRHEIRADESGAASDEDGGHGISLKLLLNNYP